MKLAIGSDKSGFSAKEAIKAYLIEAAPAASLSERSFYPENRNRKR